MTTQTHKPKTQAIPEQLVNDAPRSFTDASWPVGSVAHQGDLILVRIAAMPKKGTKPRANRQLAEGTTQGSRHVLEGGDLFDCDRAAVAKAIKTACPKADVGEQYVGPVFLTRDSVLTHPEHGDHVYEDGMVVAVVYQRNLDAEQREQRSRD